jgi:hypothetical protein
MSEEILKREDYPEFYEAIRKAYGDGENAPEFVLPEGRVGIPYRFKGKAYV